MPRQSFSLNLLPQQHQSRAHAQLGRLTALSLACAASLTPLLAQADCTTGGAVTSVLSGVQTWGAGDCSISSSGAISGGTPALSVNASVGTLINNGVIAGSEIGIRVVSSSDTVASVINNSTISAVYTYGIQNNGTIGTLSNAGTISSNSFGIYNAGAINTLTNSITGTISGGTGIYTNGAIGTLTNAGRISGSSNGMQIDSGGSIGLLTNSGVITGANDGLLNSGTINVLINSGTISDNFVAGIYNGNVIGTLINSGLIVGAVGLANLGGSIGILNNSGTISGVSFAIYNQPSSTIGLITNSGLIMGDIGNYSSVGLTINGGSGAAFGTLTGSSGGIGSADIGAIGNTLSNLSFGSGNLLLNDSINVGSHTVTNTAATLQVNNHVSITGNYHQGATAALLIGVASGAVTNGSASDTGYGRLIVSGAAVIDAGSSVTLKPVTSYGFAAGQRYVVVQAAASGTNYNAASLTYAATGYSGTVTGSVIADGSYSDLLLTLTGPSGSTSSGVTPTTPDAVAAISGLFNYNGSNLSLNNLYNAAKALPSTEAANRAGAQLSPASNATAASQVSSAPTQTVLNVAGAHVDGLRVAQLDAASGVSTGEFGNSSALWGQAYGGRTTQSQQNDVSGYRANYNGLLIGADTLLNEAWRIGGLVSYGNTSVASSGDNSGSSVHLTSYGLMGYAGYTAEDWYLDLSGGAVRHQYNTARVIDFTGFSGVANGNYNGRQYVISVQGGYPIRLNGMMDGAVLTPIAGLNYSKLYQDGYTESGGNGAALTVQANHSSSLKSDLGAKLERSFVTSYGSLAPSVQLTWRHEYQNTQLRTVADFAADTTGTTGFTTLGAKPITDTGILALAVTLTRSKNLTMTARYTVEGASGYTAQTADVRLRYQF